MERNDARSGVQELISSTNLSLPAGAVTFPGSFEESAEAYIAAQDLGIETGVACGRYCYMFSQADCETVKAFLNQRHLEESRYDLW